MELLTVEQLLQFNSLLIAKYGGTSGVREIGRLESVIATQTQVVFGAEVYPEMHDKAAAIIRNIIGDHPFHDGNKRTAMLAGLTFLKINGYALRIREGEIEDFAVIVATKQPGVQQIADWLQVHTAR